MAACDKAFLACSKHHDCAMVHHVASLWQWLFLYYHARHLPATKSSSTATRTGIPTAFYRGTVTSASFLHRDTRDSGRLVWALDALGKLCSAAPNAAILIANHQLPFSPRHATPCASYRLPSMVQRCEQRHCDGNLLPTLVIMQGHPHVSRRFRRSTRLACFTMSPGHT
jgi:hypothetical protein